jgi:hypothetical protein
LTLYSIQSCCTIKGTDFKHIIPKQLAITNEHIKLNHIIFYLITSYLGTSTWLNTSSFKYSAWKLLCNQLDLGKTWRNLQGLTANLWSGNSRQHPQAYSPELPPFQIWILKVILLSVYLNLNHFLMSFSIYSLSILKKLT